MITLGIICLVTGIVFDLILLMTFGVAVLIVGVVVTVSGFTGRPIGGRRHYF